MIRFLLKEICSNLNFYILPITEPRELFVSGLVFNEDVQTKIEKTYYEIYVFVKENLEKYNNICIERKVRPKYDQELKNRPIEKEISRPITQYDKKGHIIKSNSQLINDNACICSHPCSASIDMNPNNSDGQMILSTFDTRMEDYLKGEKFFAELIPLILAEFLQINPNYVILDVNGDFSKDLQTLFDNEIFKQMQIEKESKQILDIIDNIEIICIFLLPNFSAITPIGIAIRKQTKLNIAKHIDEKFVPCNVALENNCFVLASTTVKSGTPKSVWIEYCVKNISIHIVPIQVKNCIKQILPTCGESRKNSFKSFINVDFSPSSTFKFLESFSFINIHVQVIARTNAKAAIMN